MEKKRISMKVIIIITFILIMVVTFSIIWFIVFINWKTSKDNIISEMEQQTNTVIINKIESLINLPITINEENSNLLKNNIIGIHNKKEREQFFAGVIKTYSNEVYSFSYGTEKGEYYGARRNQNNEIEIIENDAATQGHSFYYSTKQDLTSDKLVDKTDVFDPRGRDWYKMAKEEKKPVFSPIYKHFVMDDLALSAAYPIYDSKGNLEGVLGTHIILGNINKYLKNILKGKNASAYIIEMNTGDLVANSMEQANFKVATDSQIKRININEIKDKLIVNAFRYYKSNKQNNFISKIPGEKYHIKLTKYDKDGLNWLIITSIPESQFASLISYSFRLSVIFSIAALIIAMIVYMKSADMIFKPIYNLINITEEFTRGNFNIRAKFYRNDEIGKLSTAFNQMAERIYNLIHNLEENVRIRTKELERANISLKNREDDLRLLLDSTAEAIYGVGLDGNCTFCNASCLRMLKYENQDELIGKTMHWLIHYKNADGVSIPLDECRVHNALTKGEYTHAVDEVYYRSDGTFFPVEYFSHPQYREGKIVGAVVTFMDITDRKNSEEEILYLSYHDQLTGLYNRRYFDNELIVIDSEINLPITIIMADMNGLKLINDSFGHVVGDQALKKTAELLTRVCKNSDIVVRHGGDEFVIILPKTDGLEAEQIIEQINNRALDEKIHSINISISLGYQTKNHPDEDITEIYKKAEAHMYKQKLDKSPAIKRKIIDTIINTVNEKNEFEAIHSVRVSELCEKMGEALGLSNNKIELLKKLGYFHDIGKISINEEILYKQGKLTEVEWKSVMCHSEIGYRILSTVNGMAEMAEFVLAHHERWDGSGYPKGLKGMDIPFLSRIIAIADAYDAMTSGRSYKAPITKEAAVMELKRNAGTQFDPELVTEFIEKVLV
ncbi:HD domain-containing phosphohydrolase [Anaerocolumna sp. MB42-C2]|uniref:HD domain-containing phosphohydrolase n=1 Tax=Anaerocolumna sp. MB42-C2 TaxID=3070997 RepID=UPI0027E0012D|nr:HD domain-containing phosphohydrolase [Anaerocolumna sp. MB42-C2]WMJ89086.1 diguanylate cyclase [Anaerocolumna sp. MB42-C2]